MPTETLSFLQLLNNQGLEVGDRVTISLEFADTEGYLHPTELVNTPGWLPEEVALPLFQGYLERFKKSGAPSFKSSSQDDGYKFAFEVKEQLATLIITKEEELPQRPASRGETRPRYTEDTKEEVLKLIEAGRTAKEVAEQYEISVATINLWKKAAGLTHGKRGRKPSAQPAGSEKSYRASGALPEGAITLNGVVYIPAKSAQTQDKGKAEIIRALDKLDAELAAMRAMLRETD